MDHSLTRFDTVRPWRLATLVAVGIATAELILLIVVASSLFAGHATASPTHKAHAALRIVPARHKSTAHHMSAVNLSRHQVGILVLNGNGLHGAASSAAARVRRRGYRVAGVGNARRMDYTRSIVMYRSGFEAEGRRLGRDLGVAIVGPLDGMRPAQLRGAKAVLVVG